MYNHIVCGGTFDRFHQGHKQLLDFVAKLGKTITIGITSDVFIRNKPHTGTIQSISTRKRLVHTYMSGLSTSYRLLTIHDQWGDTLTNTTYDCIVVSKETINTAIHINNKRIQAGMKPLSIEVVPFFIGQNNTPISSEQVRKGVINRQGESYIDFLFSKNKFIMPNKLKKRLRIPLGRIHKGSIHCFIAKICLQSKKKDKKNTPLCIAVGDIVTSHLLRAGVYPFISIVDGKTQRKALNDKIKQTIFIKGRSINLNPHGKIFSSTIQILADMIQNASSKAIQQLEIQGEEDLMVLPLVLLAPLGSFIWYGLRNRGAVQVIVTEKKKETVYNLMKQFN